MTRVPRICEGGIVVCLGGGPSLTQEDVTYCRGRANAVIAVNDAYRMAPWADVLYACDAKWWRWHKGVPEFKGLKYSLQREATKWPGVQVLRNTGKDGLERDPSGVKTGQNGGYQAVNLAVHLGASRIVLLGYDMCVGTKGEVHWFGDHPDKQAPPLRMFAGRFRQLVKPLAESGVTVINASRRTVLTMFPRMSLERALA